MYADWLIKNGFTETIPARKRTPKATRPARSTPQAVTPSLSVLVTSLVKLPANITTLARLADVAPILAPARATIPQAAPGGPQASAAPAPVENPAPVAIKAQRTLTIFDCPQWQGYTGTDFYGRKVTPSSVVTQYCNEWVVSVPAGFTPRPIPAELTTIPYHHPIPGATVKAGEPGKVIVVCSPDKSGLKSGLMYLCEKFAKYSNKHGGYVMNFKKFAEFIHAKNNSTFWKD